MQRISFRKGIVIVLAFSLLLPFSALKAYALGPVGPFQLIFQEIMEKIFERELSKALSPEYRRSKSEFSLMAAKTEFDRIYKEQKSKLKQKHELELSELQDKFNERWSSEKATGTIDERMEKAKQAKAEEETAFLALRERHQKEEQEQEEAYQWIIEHYINKRYSEYLEELKNAKMQEF